MIDEQLVVAYKATTFTVHHPFIEIRIGKLHPELDTLLQKSGEKDWAYITAWNPFSKTLSDKENDKRHLELIEKVKSYIYFEGAGIGDDPSWQPERSLLIIGIPREEAVKIGKHFEQNAIVTGTKGNVAELVLLQ